MLDNRRETALSYFGYIACLVFPAEFCNLKIMISIEETKKLLDDPEMSDEEAREMRDACYALAELILEVYFSSKKEDKPKK